MTCVDLPDTVDLSGQEFDQSVVRDFSQMEQPRQNVVAHRQDEIQPFTKSQKPFFGPKVVRVGVPRALNFEGKIADEVGESTRNCCFFVIDVLGQRNPRLKRFRKI